MYAYLRSVWDCRYFWLSLVRMDLRARYRGSVLGMGWSLLNPILMTAILCLAFSTIFRQDPRIFAPFLFAGLTIWNFILGVTQQGCLCFFQAESYIRQFPAPMAIYPLRTVLATAFHFLMGLVPVLLLSGWANGWVGLPALASLIPSLFLLLLLGWSIAVLVGVANVHFRDTRHLIDIAMQVFFYLTPIMYPPDLMAGRRIGQLLQLNPLVPFLRLVRDTILHNQVPPLSAYVSASAIVAVFLGSAAIALWSEERRLVFHL